MTMTKSAAFDAGLRAGMEMGKEANIKSLINPIATGVNNLVKPIVPQIKNVAFRAIAPMNAAAQGAHMAAMGGGNPIIGAIGGGLSNFRPVAGTALGAFA